MMGFADAPAIENNVIAGFEAGIGGGFDRAGEIDAGNERPAADDRGLAGEGQRILVVEGGVRDAHGDVAVHEVAIAKTGKFGLLAVIIPGNEDCLECLGHRKFPFSDPYSAAASLSTGCSRIGQ